MRTIRINANEMASRIARYRDLKPLPIQMNNAIAQAAKDVVYARELRSVIGLDQAGGSSPINTDAPIRGAGGMTLTIAVCPPGQGPGLHAHQATFETFTVLKGRFEVRWNDDGDETAILNEWDTISLPPGVCRAFRNVGDADAVLQVIITGGVHDMNDIAFAPRAAADIIAAQPSALVEFKKVGFTFNAGQG